MSLSVFLMLLLIVSTFTGLVTEAIKKCLQERDKTYHANTLAGVVAVGLSIAVGTTYTILAGAEISAQLVVYLAALVFLSWLAAMVGYDKVIQTIAQISGKRSQKEESDE